MGGKQVMEERLKRIEEKLDILLAAMSANPEFENFVKEGKLKLHMDYFKANFTRTESERRSSKCKHISGTIAQYAERHQAITDISRGPVSAFHYASDAPDYAKEMIFELAQRAEKVGWDLNKMEGSFAEDVLCLESFCPLMKEHLNRVFGKEGDTTLELEKERLRYLEENK